MSMSFNSQPVTRATRLTRRLAVASAGLGAAVVLVASPAWGHINPEPSSVVGGTQATVGFNVQHGCDGSATTKVEIQAPDGATDISGVNGDGFTSSTAGRVVTFTGGPLDAETAKVFKIAFTVPNTPGEVPVKIIQTCEEGSIEWIQVAEAGGAEPEHPAPLLTITAGTTPTTTVQESPETTTTPDSATNVTPTTEAPSSSGREIPDDDDEFDDDDSDDSSVTPLVIGMAVAIAVAGVGGFALAKRGSKKDSSNDDSGS